MYVYFNRISYSDDFHLEPELYNYYQQPVSRPIDVPLQCPMMINYQYASIENNHGSTSTQQPLSSQKKLVDWQCQQSIWPMENPKKRMNDGQDQKVANKKLAHRDQMQEIGCVRERVPMRRSQKLADKITALQKLVSPYGKTDTASVLQEAHISIKLLHDQIKVHFIFSKREFLREKPLEAIIPIEVFFGEQNLVQKTQTSMINVGPLQFQEAETDLHKRGLCLVPISIPEINNQERQNFMPRSY
ncbi:hypothetical protein OSB04_026511 [Centaurea solstitialis]|uniref:BHLH domain-containing protein n=1 Tax=Centaurea solstitialis TaxID=347529 RepID=A0AA38W5Y7_9ASTR|nr:hypothetical protein OSB04_026511 [Centaurea solstitialis]